MMTVEDVARVCYEANRAYCRTHGDLSFVDWGEAPKWQCDTCIDGVKYHLGTPGATASSSHENWLALKEKEGWKYGVTKDPERKLHPCMVPFHELPQYQQVKDRLFKAVIDALREKVWELDRLLGVHRPGLAQAPPVSPATNPPEQ